MIKRNGAVAPHSDLAALTAALDASRTVEAACRALEAAIAPFDYVSVDYASGPISRWPMHSNLDWRPDVIYATFNWQDEYFTTHFQAHDRTLPHMLGRITPWLYWDLWATPSDDPVTRELERRVHERVASGLSIPFHGPGLRFAGANLGSNLSASDFEARDRETRAEVFLMASLTHGRIQAITGGAPSPAGLSGREAEVLGWSARGKTAWETGAILGISESAVKKHLGSANTKLGAQTGAHAVAIALSRGLIAL